MSRYAVRSYNIDGTAQGEAIGTETVEDALGLAEAGIFNARLFGPMGLEVFASIRRVEITCGARVITVLHV